MGRKKRLEESCTDLKGVFEDKSVLSPALPEVWDSTRCADACPCHHHNLLKLAFSDIFCNVLKGLLVNIVTASSKQASCSTAFNEGSSVKSKCVIKIHSIRTGEAYSVPGRPTPRSFLLQHAFLMSLDKSSEQRQASKNKIVLLCLSSRKVKEHFWDISGMFFIHFSCY